MFVQCDISEGIAYITIQREEALNAFNDAVLQELNEALDVVEREREVRVVIITGQGKAFVAGGDIQSLQKMSVMESTAFVYAGQALLNRIEHSAKVFIAAVNGLALGGGAELAMACDIRIAAEHVKFGYPEVTIGLYPAWGGTQRLPRLVGMGKAKELILTGSPIAADEALGIGLVNKVVPLEKLLSTCERMATRIVGNAPIAVGQAKRAMQLGSQVSMEQGLIIEAEGFGVNAATKDRVEGLTAFLEKRKPNFLGE